MAIDFNWKSQNAGRGEKQILKSPSQNSVPKGMRELLEVRERVFLDHGVVDPSCAFLMLWQLCLSQAVLFQGNSR